VTSPPRVSVVIGVRDGARWLAEAVDSVLGQTLADLELIVVDDGSTDATPDLLAGYRDPRLSVLRQPPAGLARALNRGLRLASAPLVARLDADDVALPERLARQVAFLDAQPEVGLLGSACRAIGPSGDPLDTERPPQDDVAIRRALIRRNPFVHSTIVMRRIVIDRAGGYDESLPVAQDYELWMRASAVTRMANLPEVLVLRRLRADRVSVARDTERLRAEVRVKLTALRAGVYPAWCGIFLLKPLAALALPAHTRHALRRWRRGY
jgi:glycosyltransferase involved in cell wall biosynthesis